MCKIEIYIACHKETMLPSNSLFIPTQSGSALASKFFEGMQRDDEGENISLKNPHYNELDIQYWAWKHSDAEYIGLCHYRRYLYLGNKTFHNLTKDNRKQIFVDVLSQYTAEEYGLLDREQMKKEICSYDMLIPRAYDISKVYTPNGLKKTVLQHWFAHDGALIKEKDLKLLIHLVQENYPEIYPYMMKFLNDKYFYGYNMFIMRQRLFHAMCEFEFSVLEHMEKFIDYTTYNEQEYRIFGFMGEILSSAYIYYLMNSKKNIKVKQCPILYFDDTDKLSPLIPIKECTPIVINSIGIPAYLLYPLFNSLIEHVSKNLKLDIIVLIDEFSEFFKKYFESMLKEDCNAQIRFINLKKSIKRLDPPIYNKKLDLYFPIFLPWVLRNYEKCYYLKWNSIIKSSSIFDLTDSMESLPIKAVKDIYMEGKLNSYKSNDKKFTKKIRNIVSDFDTYQIYNDGFLYLNLAKLRKHDLNDVYSIILNVINKIPNLPIEYIFNIIYQKYIEELPQTYNYFVYSNKAIDFYIHLSPKELLTTYKGCEKKGVLLYRYDLSVPVNILDNEKYFLEYWGIIKQSEFVNAYMMFFSDLKNLELNKSLKFVKIINRIFPKGSKRRDIIKRIMNKKLFSK